MLRQPRSFESFERNVGLGERLRLGIEEDILAGRLAPGDRLEERALAARYNVSRTPVREALLQLSTLGLVSMRPRQPAYIAAIELDTLIEMIETMSFFEAQLARLAARRMTDSECRELLRIQQQADEIVKTGDAGRFNEANWKLHLAIFEGSRNRFLAAHARNLRLRLHPYRCYLVAMTRRIAAAHGEHDDIVQAIVAGDGERAFEAMRQHLAWDTDQLSDLTARMSQRSPSPQPQVESTVASIGPNPSL
jgi:DNA-binding GntR family transcriptional regulator